MGSIDLQHFIQPHRVYPIKEDAASSRFEQWVDGVILFYRHWLVRRRPGYPAFVKRVEAREAHFQALSDTELTAFTEELARLVKAKGIGPYYFIEAFAYIREVSKRTLGMRHFSTQLAGGWAMVNGMIAEMETGQGKTLTATLAAGAMALAGVPAHVITVNGYLAERDAESMGPLYNALGLRVGVIKEESSESDKREIYTAEIVYCTNKDVTFDHLRDRMVMASESSDLHLQLDSFNSRAPKLNKLVLKGLFFGIVDEADSVLIDEAVTPLIISASIPPGKRGKVYLQAVEFAQQLTAGKDFRVDLGERDIALLPAGAAVLQDWGRREGGLWNSNIVAESLVVQGLKALYLFIRDKHYLVRDDKIQIIDESTGRIMADRSWEQGLHQMIEIKEGCTLTGERETLGQISYQRFFRRYIRLSGMTGTASEVKPELRKVYRLNVLKIPTAQRVQRRFLPEVIYTTAEAKWRHILDSIQAVHASGRPVLIGTRSLAVSEALAHRLGIAGLPYRLLNARQDKEEASILAEAGQTGRITVATNMAGRGTDIKLSDEVKRLGGLHVIATERHESRRIDRQLFGRCGRQGDPGTVEVILSLEDDLMHENCHPLLLKLLGVFANRQGAIGGVFVRYLFKRAQNKAERRNFIARSRVQKLDEHYSKMLAFSGRME